MRYILSRVNLLLITNLLCSEGNTVDKDLTLSTEQKGLLDKFQTKVTPFVPHDYMKKEIYLIRWLRASQFDIGIAEKLLFENLKWRKENQIDGILDEDWSEMELNFDYSIHSVDKEGQPVVFAPFGRWDFRQAVLSGKGKRLERYIYKLLEDGTRTVHKLQDEGKLVTRYQIIIDLEGFNMVQHGCMQCITVYLALARGYESYFPQWIDHIVMIKAPSIFQVVLNMIKPALSFETRNSLEIYTANRNIWKDALLKYIEEKELPAEYSGVKSNLL